MAKRKRKTGLIGAIINSVADAVKDALVPIAAIVGGTLAAGAGADPVVVAGIAAAGVTGLRRLGDELKERALGERVKALEELASLSPADIDTHLQSAGLQIAELRAGMTRLLVNVAEVSAEHADRIDELATQLEQHLKDHPPTHLSDIPLLFVDAVNVWISADSVHIQTKDTTVTGQTVLVSGRAKPGSRWNVPIPQNKNFVGREDDMHSLRDAIEGTREKGEVVNVVGATGIGGIGKSQLAAEYAHKYRDDYTGGVYWVDAGSEDLTSEFYKLGPFMGIDLPEQPTTEAIQAVVIKVMNHLGGKEAILLILDNVTEPKILQGWTLPGPGWLPPAGECRVLATSRRTDLPNTANLDIDKLAPPAAFDLLTAKRRPKGRKEEDAAERICRQVDCLPLALEIAGAYLGEYESVTFAGFSELIEEKGALDPLDDAAEGKITFAHGEIGVRAVVKEMTSQIKGDTLKLLLAVGCAAPVSMDPGMLAATADLDMEAKSGRPSPFDRAANELLVASLLKRDDTTGRLLAHGLVHAFAREELATPTERGSVASRFTRLLGQIFDSADAITMLRYLLREAPHCEAAHALALAIGDGFGVCKIATGLGTLHLHLSDFPHALTWLDRALDAARSLPDKKHLAAALGNIGVVRQDLGQFDLALAADEEALEIAERLFGSDHPRLITALNNVGTALLGLKRLDEAEAVFTRALGIAEAHHGPLHPTVASCHNGIGGALFQRGEHGPALKRFRRAIFVHIKVHSRQHPQIATDLSNIANALVALSKLRPAFSGHMAALAIDEFYLGPHSVPVARHCHNAGALLVRAGQPRDAVPLLCRAYAICRRALGFDHPQTNATAEWLREIGLDPEKDCAEKT